jgi:uncharacterized protein (UPF0371 family)
VILRWFPVVKRILKKITGEEPVYHSPTDLGVNRVGFGITKEDGLNKMKVILEEVGLKQDDLACVAPAREYIAKLRGTPKDDECLSVIALELTDGTIITGRGSSLMGCCSAGLLNAIKHLTGLSDNILLLSPLTLETIKNMKKLGIDVSCEPIYPSENLYYD